MTKKIKNILRNFWRRCSVSGHDWFVIDTYQAYTSYYETQFQRKVCLKCKEIVDEITPQLRLEAQQKQQRQQRARLAGKIWEDRHKHWWDEGKAK